MRLVASEGGGYLAEIDNSPYPDLLSHFLSQRLQYLSGYYIDAPESACKNKQAQCDHEKCFGTHRYCRFAMNAEIAVRESRHLNTPPHPYHFE